MINRRTFLKNTAVAGTALLLNPFAFVTAKSSLRWRNIPKERPKPGQHFLLAEGTNPVLKILGHKPRKVPVFTWWLRDKNDEQKSIITVYGRPPQTYIFDSTHPLSYDSDLYIKNEAYKGFYKSTWYVEHYNTWWIPAQDIIDEKWTPMDPSPQYDKNVILRVKFKGQKIVTLETAQKVKFRSLNAEDQKEVKKMLSYGMPRKTQYYLINRGCGDVEFEGTTPIQHEQRTMMYPLWDDYATWLYLPEIPKV